VAEFFKDFAAAFVPIFVAVDPLGMAALFLALTEEYPGVERRRIARDSVLTAFVLSVGFVLTGGVVFRFMGITGNDFLIAGGSILFVLALLDLGGIEKVRRLPGRAIGIVPLGTPLIAGPALFTTGLLMVQEHGLAPTMLSLTVNLTLLWLSFRFADQMARTFGSAVLRAISKLVTLLLAAFGVMLVRKGILAIVEGG
jgi:multiple antibiotic resistance protein